MLHVLGRLLPPAGASVAGRGLAIGCAARIRFRNVQQTARFGTLAEFDVSADEADKHVSAVIDGETLRVVWADGFTYNLYV